MIIMCDDDDDLVILRSNVRTAGLLQVGPRYHRTRFPFFPDILLSRHLMDRYFTHFVTTVPSC